MWDVTHKRNSYPRPPTFLSSAVLLPNIIKALEEALGKIANSC